MAAEDWDEWAADPLSATVMVQTRSSIVFVTNKQRHLLIYSPPFVEHTLTVSTIVVKKKDSVTPRGKA
jgi:hypothetical protein